MQHACMFAFDDLLISTTACRARCGAGMEKEKIEMEKKKVRATRTNGRKDSKGVFKAGHNDRSFNLENAEHVDADRSKWNVYWDYLQGYNLADENGVRLERKYLFDEVEYLYYHKQFGDSIDAQNERHEKSRHTERIRNVRQIMEDSRTCLEETIYQLGTKDGYEDPAVFVKVAAELFEVIQEKYGSHMQILDWLCIWMKQHHIFMNVMFSLQMMGMV